MKKINLRELYPDVYITDFFVDVTEEVMETIRAAERAEAAYERKMYRYKAQYSLSRALAVVEAQQKTLLQMRTDLKDTLTKAELDEKYPLPSVIYACSPIKVTSDEQWDWSKIQNFADEAGELHTITLQAHEEPGLKEGSTSALHSVPNFIVQVSNGATLQMGKDVRMPCWIVKHYGQQVAIPTPFRLRLCLRFLNRKQINQREALKQA